MAELAWSPDNSILASAGFDSKIILWDGKSFGKESDFKKNEIQDEIISYVFR